MPNKLHAIRTIDDAVYSMISIGIPFVISRDEFIEGDSYSKKLIMDILESLCLIDAIALKIGVSAYHMIHQFKFSSGLAPHQFQIPCQIRKAQRLLEEGKSVVEVS